MADINSLSGTIKRYQVLGNPRMLETYRKTDDRLAATRTQLAELLTDEPTRQSLDSFKIVHSEISRAVDVTPPGSPAFDTILTRIDSLNDLANG